jgi:hypothetical protein
MKFTQIVGVATVVSLVIFTSNTKAIPAINTINLGQSTNFYKNSFIQHQDKILQVSNLNFVNSNFDDNQKFKCKISKSSMPENWINLLGRLIIIGSFGSVGVMSNSVAIERYVKLIFKDILPVFLIIFISISLLGIASAIALTSFPSSTSLTASSISSQNSCILK